MRNLCSANGSNPVAHRSCRRRASLPPSTYRPALVFSVDNIRNLCPLNSPSPSTPRKKQPFARFPTACSIPRTDECIVTRRKSSPHNDVDPPGVFGRGRDERRAILIPRNGFRTCRTPCLRCVEGQRRCSNDVASGERASLGSGVSTDAAGSGTDSSRRVRRLLRTNFELLPMP